MRQDLDQATSTYSKEIAKLRQENEQIKKRYEETSNEISSKVTSIEQSKAELSETLRQSEREKEQMASELNHFKKRVS